MMLMKFNFKLELTLHFRGEIRDSTLGRFLFNEIFPEDFPFQDDAMS